MKKILAISSVLLGVVFLAGCGQQPVSQTQPTIPAPVTQQPENNQPVATQPTPTTPAVQPTPPAVQPITPVQTGKQGAVYTNVEYGFRFTMPQEWMGIIGDYETVISKIESDGTPFVEFAAKATDSDWLNYQEPGLPKGYSELFRVGIVKKSDWDKSVKTCKKGLEPCLTDAPVLGEKGSNIFVLWTPQEGPSNFTMFKTEKMKIANPTDIIKSGFELLNP